MKPLTYVMTYRGVEGFSQGLHPGNNRDVLIAGDEIPGLEIERTMIGRQVVNEVELGGTEYASAEEAKRAYMMGAEHMQQFMDRIDRMYVYLGANGAGPGFQWVREMLAREPKPTISLVACDCGRQKKTDFALSNGLGLMWSECGGKRTLARIVRDEMGI